jgi:predicted site-specific integrase-resolvase
MTGVSPSTTTATISPREAADHYEVVPKTILRWAALGLLQSVTLPSGRIRIAVDADGKPLEGRMS